MPTGVRQRKGSNERHRNGRPSAGLTYAFRLIDHAGHAGEKAESYMRGMQYVFAPIAPKH